MFVDYVFSSAFVAMDYLKVPAAIYSGYQGDFAPAAQAWLDRLAFRHGATGPGAWTYSHGLYYTASCLQDGTLGTAAEAKAIYDKVKSDPSIHDWAVSAWISDTLAVCPDWKLTPPSPNIAVEPVSSAIPTLMLEGVFDNALPAFLSRPAATRLSNGYFIELPAGHALVLTPCGVNLINQFLTDPSKAPDASCIDKMTMDWVLPQK
jgi:pimeloyl-ACP methyl ester carboxylesterase